MSSLTSSLLGLFFLWTNFIQLCTPPRREPGSATRQRGQGALRSKIENKMKQNDKKKSKTNATWILSALKWRYRIILSVSRTMITRTFRLRLKKKKNHHKNIVQGQFWKKNKTHASLMSFNGKMFSSYSNF